MAMGQASGTAVALALPERAPLGEVAVVELQERLTGTGAVLDSRQPVATLTPM